MASFLFWSGLIGIIVISLTWVLYPATIGFFSLFSSVAEQQTGETPTVSVILATREDNDLVRWRVANLSQGEYPKDLIEIIVALDSGGDSSTLEILELTDLIEAKVVRSGGPPGKAATLNEGVRQARGTILVFADTHQEFAPDAIRELVGAFSDPKIGAASGNLVLRKREKGFSLTDLYWKYEKWLREREARVHSPVGVTGAVSAVRASLWEPLPEGLILDDVFTPMRLVLNGHRVAFVKTALAFETRQPSPSQEHLRNVRTLTGVLQLCAWSPELLLPWRNPLFLQFVFHKLFRLLTPYAVFFILLAGARSAFLLFEQALIPLSAFSFGCLLLVFVGWPRPVRSIRGGLIELAQIQVAVVKATINGLRGRWGVWS